MHYYVHYSTIYIAKVWKQLKCPSTNERIKMWGVCIWNRLLSHKRRRNLAICDNTDEAMMLKELSQTEKDKYYVISFLCGIIGKGSTVWWWVETFGSTYSIHRRRQWHPTPVLLPGKSHGWRSLVGCSPWGRWESDTTERLHFHFSLSCLGEGNGNPLQCSCLENPRDGGAWWAAVYGVAQSWKRLKQLSSSSNIVYINWIML